VPEHTLPKWIDQLTACLGSLSSALDRVILQMVTDSTQLQAKDWREILKLLRTHTTDVKGVAALSPQCARESEEYVSELQQLRREIMTCMSLPIAPGDGLRLSEELEAMYFQVLSVGVLWVDRLQQLIRSPGDQAGSERQTTQGSLAGVVWEKVRAAATELSLQSDSDIELDQLLYASLATQVMQAQDLRHLASEAASMNRMDRITGILMHADGVFVQLIEGPPEAVKHLWQRLKRDKRHNGLVQLYFQSELETRSCVGWNMRWAEREELAEIVHEARIFADQSPDNAWIAAIQKMDFLLSSADWSKFVEQLKRGAVVV
jgi:Sensors of blue-light using FAD